MNILTEEYIYIYIYLARTNIISNAEPFAHQRAKIHNMFSLMQW